MAATAAASHSLLRNASRRRVGTAKTAPEPWFALNRNAYQAILNVALAEMTSSSSSVSAVISDGERGNAASGSELMRLLRPDDDFGEFDTKKAATMVNENCYMTARTGSGSPLCCVCVEERGLSDDVDQSRCEQEVAVAVPTSDGRLLMHTNSSVTNSDVMTEMKSGVDEHKSRETENKEDDGTNTWETEVSKTKNEDCSTDRRDSSLYSGQLLDSSKSGTMKVEPVEEISDIDFKLTPDAKSPAVNDEMSASAEKMEPSTIGDVASSSNDIDDDADSIPPSRIDGGRMSSSSVSRDAEMVVSSEQKPLACWVPIDKNVVVTIVERELTQRSGTDGNRSSSPLSLPFPVTQPSRDKFQVVLAPTTVSSSSSTTSTTLPVRPDSAAASRQISPPAAHRSRLLADLLHQTDDFTGSAVPEVASIAAARKRQSAPTLATGCFGTFTLPQTMSQNSDLSPTKKPKWSIDDATDIDLLTKSRIQVRSTWPVPGTIVDEYFTTSCNRLPSTSPVSRSSSDCGSRRRSGDPSIGVGHGRFVASGCGGRDPSGAPQSAGVESSQVWTAIDKNVVLDVIDQLLDLDVVDDEDDDDIDIGEESAIDLTVVRHSDVARTASNAAAISLSSKRDLMALLSCGSAAYRMQAQPFHSDRGKHLRRSEVDETGNDREFEFGIGVSDSTETSSQLKWKSNIMQRMRREQTTIAHGVTMGTPSGGQAWRRGGSSIAATGS